MEDLINSLKLMPLHRVVILITGEADKDDPEGIKKAVKGWHNKLANGSVPRSMFKKIGKNLYLDIEAFQDWLDNQDKKR